MDLRSESFQLVTDRLSRSDALWTIDANARAYGVHVEAVEERRRAVTIELTVTVSGSTEAIDAFRDAVAGNGFDGWGSGLGDAILDEALGDLTKSVQRMLRRRRRRAFED